MHRKTLDKKANKRSVDEKLFDFGGNSMSALLKGLSKRTVTRECLRRPCDEEGNPRLCTMHFMMGDAILTADDPPAMRTRKLELIRHTGSGQFGIFRGCAECLNFVPADRDDIYEGLQQVLTDR
jgi:hypothetical protein